jgi:hypothetical protein
LVEMRDNIHHNTVRAKLWFSFALIFSFLVALVGSLAPQRRMPVDFHLMLWFSLPLSGIWLATAIASIFRFRQKGLWLLIGAPFALYWPVWLMFNHIPTCYWLHNCI